MVLDLVCHELPPKESRAAFAEAHRILAPGGQLWVCEMDFEAPGFVALRKNPLLFSLIRATEPYLDQYADYQASGQVALGVGGGAAAASSPLLTRRFAAIIPFVVVAVVWLVSACKGP